MPLNLLPPERKQQVISKRRNRKITAIGAGIIGVIVLAALVLFVASIYMGTIISSQKKRIEDVNASLAKNADVEQMVLSIRDRVNSLAAQEKSRVLWSKVLDEIAVATPDGIQITQLSFSTENAPNLQVSGEAGTKEEVAAFRDRLEASDRFEQMTITQIGQSQALTGKTLATFSIEGVMTGVAVQKSTTQSTNN